MATFTCSVLFLALAVQDPAPAPQTPDQPAVTAPAATVTAEAEAPDATTQQDPDADARRLAAAEKAGKKADANELIALLSSTSPGVAARAAWLLGQSGAKNAVEPLCALLSASTDVEQQKQLLMALRALNDVRAEKAVTAALDSTDRTVRAIAVQTLSRMQAPGLERALLGMLATAAGEAGNQPAPDVVNALLALCDAKKVSAVLPAASTITEQAHTDVAQALTFMLQTLTPTQEKAAETRTLLAVLDHPQSLVRRYAIMRLGVLGDRSAAAALEGRLASESKELQPLVQLSLDALRGEHPAADVDESILERAQKNFAVLWQMGRQKWASLTEQQQMIVMSSAGGALFVLLLVVMLRRRAARNRRAVAAAALAAPSVQDFAPVSYEEQADEQPADDRPQYPTRF